MDENETNVIFEEKLRKSFQKKIEIPKSFTQAIKSALNEENIKKYKKKQRREKFKFYIMLLIIIVFLLTIFCIIL